MSRSKLLYSSLVAAVLGANLAAARAAPPPLGLLEGRAQLQLQLGLIDYSKVHGDVESRLGVKSTATTKGAQYGLASRVGLSLGYGVTEKVQLALLLGFATRTGSSSLTVAGESSKDVSTRSGTLQLIPQVRYVAGEGGQRFYVGAAAGFERDRTKLYGDGPDTVSKHALLGGQLGVYFFIQQHVSLEPGLELYYVKGSTQITPADQAQDDIHRDDNGFRVLLTLGLSVWSGGDGTEAPVASAPAPVHQPDPGEKQYLEARIDDLDLRLVGTPQRVGTEITLGLTTHGVDDPPRCEVALLSDEPPQQLELAWWLDGADETGPLQSGSGRARVKLLEHWLAHNPSLTVCKRLYVVSAAVRSELLAALARFQSEAVSAGTRQPEPVASEPERASPEAQPASPEADNRPR